MKLGIKILSLLFLLALVFTSCTKLEEIKPDDTLEQVFNRNSEGDLDSHGDSSSDEDDSEGDIDTINDDDDDEDEDDIEDGAERDTQ